MVALNKDQVLNWHSKDTAATLSLASGFNGKHEEINNKKLVFFCFPLNSNVNRGEF